MNGTLPTYSVILNPVDGSLASCEATLQAIALAKLTGATVCAMYVVDEAAIRRAGVNVDHAIREMRKRGEEMLAAVVQRAAPEGVTVKTVILEGNPGASIVENAAKERASLIVMGTTGYRDIEHLLTRLGSVAEYVVKNASCPVLITRAS